MKYIIQTLTLLLLISCNDQKTIGYNLFELKQDIGYTFDRGDGIDLIHTWRKERSSLPKGTQLMCKFKSGGRNYIFTEVTIHNGRYKGRIVDITSLKKQERIDYLSLIKKEGNIYAFEENLNETTLTNGSN